MSIFDDIFGDVKAAAGAVASVVSTGGQAIADAATSTANAFSQFGQDVAHGFSTAGDIPTQFVHSGKALAAGTKIGAAAIPGLSAGAGAASDGASAAASSDAAATDTAATTNPGLTTPDDTATIDETQGTTEGETANAGKGVKAGIKAAQDTFKSAQNQQKAIAQQQTPASPPVQPAATFQALPSAGIIGHGGGMFDTIFGPSVEPQPFNVPDAPVAMATQGFGTVPAVPGPPPQRSFQDFHAKMRGANGIS